MSSPEFLVAMQAIISCLQHFTNFATCTNRLTTHQYQSNTLEFATTLPFFLLSQLKMDEMISSEQSDLCMNIHCVIYHFCIYFSSQCSVKVSTSTEHFYSHNIIKLFCQKLCRWEVVNNAVMVPGANRHLCLPIGIFYLYTFQLLMFKSSSLHYMLQSREQYTEALFMKLSL